MKKMKKLLSVVLSGIMALSIFGGMSVNAEDEAKIYKLSELFSMSKEEFLSLGDQAERKYAAYKSIYNSAFDYIKYDGENEIPVHEYRGLACNTQTFSINCRDVGEKYKPYITEKAISELLDTEFYNGLNIKINSSPITNGEEPEIDYNGFYWSMYIGIGKNADYCKKDPDGGVSDMSDDEWILKFAKTSYCISQIIPVYYAADTFPAANLDLFGDANEDGELTIRDAAFIAIKLAGNKAKEIPEIADINNDGQVTIRDAAYIARLLCARQMVKAEGLGK